MKNKNDFKNNFTAKMLLIGALIAILMIPLFFVSSLVTERNARKVAMESKTQKEWGEDVLLYGPALKIPYSVKQDADGTYDFSPSYRKYLYVFPEKLDVQSTVDNQEKSRGIFTTNVFDASMKIKGNFKSLSLQNLGVPNEAIAWDKLQVLVRSSNLKGLNEEVTFTINNTEYPFEANRLDRNTSTLDQLLSNPLKSLDVEKPILFDIQLSYNGSNAIQCIPVGKVTTVHMESNWPNPKSIGDYLPREATKEISANGFVYDWKVLHLNRPFQQVHQNYLPNLASYAFGVSFIQSVDDYTKIDRSVKYGILVISLTFLVYFLIQVISKIYMHPFHYLMIGLALILFYTLLLSIAEHSSYNVAYAISSIATIALISLYSKALFKNSKLVVLILGALSLLYAFIYVIIQLEKYALLVGSIGLFIILALVMYFSRKIQWDVEE